MSEEKVSINSIPEHDKLGPLGARVSLPSSDDLRGALLAEFRDAIDRARRAAADAKTSPNLGVHDYRKALRRARAALGLVACALPSAEYKAIRRVLRDARRSVSVARDHTVAPDALSKLTLDDADRAIAEATVGAARDAAPAHDDVAQLAGDGAARAAAQVEALEAALPSAIEWSTVADGLAATYREARRARRKARKSRRSFHAWRRRTKELTHQLDLIARHGGERTAALRDEWVALSDQLGDVVDQIMLREFIATHGGNQDRDAVSRCLDAIDDHVRGAIKRARRAGRDLFGERRKRFVRRIAKASRRDLEPRAAPEAQATAAGTGPTTTTPGNGTPIALS
jgi:CHAD domain-containing protein